MICLGSGSSINSQKQNIAPSTCPAGDTASAPQHGRDGEGLLKAAWSVYCSAVSLSREVSAASAAKQRPAAQSPARQQPGSRSCGCSAQFVLTGRFLSSCWDFKKTRRASNFCIFFFPPRPQLQLEMLRIQGEDVWARVTADGKRPHFKGGENTCLVHRLTMPIN